MAKVYSFCVGVLTGLVLCAEAVRNTTEGLSANATECGRHGNEDNCTDTETGQWNGHFSACPEKLSYYCIHGDCRYIKEMDVASCRCHPGYLGSRCELLDFDWRRGERQTIIITCAVGGLVLLILFIIFICCFSHRRGKLCRQKSRNEPKNGTEKLHLEATSTLIPDSTEQPSYTTNSV
ncbi:hypothetical protein WMY93_021831 [Mugilogobius chulae]|uniref:EGF-like domain-containing protein n=1 Tax=Mugilogobius chulae TaxID=88201 RepID=A0AAW0NHI4_9GOBI